MKQRDESDVAIGADLALMDNLADKAITAGSGTDGFPYFQACKAMSHYRQGDFSEAIAWGDETAIRSSDFARARAYAALALLHWQLSQRNEARAALGKGDAFAPVISPENHSMKLRNSPSADQSPRRTRTHHNQMTTL